MENIVLVEVACVLRLLEGVVPSGSGHPWCELAFSFKDTSQFGTCQYMCISYGIPLLNEALCHRQCWTTSECCFILSTIFSNWMWFGTTLGKKSRGCDLLMWMTCIMCTCWSFFIFLQLAKYGHLPLYANLTLLNSSMSITGKEMRVQFGACFKVLVDTTPSKLLPNKIFAEALNMVVTTTVGLTAWLGNITTPDGVMSLLYLNFSTSS